MEQELVGVIKLSPSLHSDMQQGIAVDQICLECNVYFIGFLILCSHYYGQCIICKVFNFASLDRLIKTIRVVSASSKKFIIPHGYFV